MIAVDLQNHSLSSETGTIPADHPREGHGYGIIAATVGHGGHSNNPLDETLVASTLSSGGHPGSAIPGRHKEDDENLVVGSTIDEAAARPLVARASGYRMDLESETFVVASPVSAQYVHHNHFTPRGDGNLVVADPISAHEGKTYTHEGKNNFRTHNVVEAFHTAGYGASVGGEAATLQASDARLSNQVSGLISPMGVRRLTPLECERLQGWPDDHTRWTHDGKEIPDSHRYRMIGNGVVAPVAEWIGHRLLWVDSL
jgi:site-specific DNA-cytosine methylase